MRVHNFFKISAAWTPATVSNRFKSGTFFSFLEKNRDGHIKFNKIKNIQQQKRTFF